MAKAFGTAPASPLSSVLHLLHRAGQRADRVFTSHVGDALTPRQLAILQAVAEADGLSQTDIMAATGIDRSSTAELVRRLVAHGWLTRRRTKKDERVYSVKLTVEGRRALTQGTPAAHATDQALLASIPQPLRAAFVQALAIIGAQSR